MKTTTVEWIYTLEKSVISKAFNQPTHARRLHDWAMTCSNREDCINYYLLWVNTHEGHAFWSRINLILEGEKEVNEND